MNQETPTRLAESTSGEEHARLAYHLRNTLPPAPLSQRQVSDLEARLSSAIERSRRRSFVGFAPVLAAAGVVGVLLAARIAPRPSHVVGAGTASVPPSVIAPAGAVTIIRGDEQSRAVLIGAGRIEPPAASAPNTVTLLEGRLAVRTSNGEQIVASPRGAIIVRPRSLVEIEVRPYHVRILAFRGRAAAKLTRAAATEVEAGQMLTPAGIVSLDESQRAEIERAFAPEEADGPPAPQRAPFAQDARPRSVAPATAPAHGPQRSPTARDDGRDVASRTVAQRGIGGKDHQTQRNGGPTDDTDGLGVEGRLVAGAIEALHRDDPRRALIAIEDYRSRFPSGELRPESDRVLVEVLLRLGERARALSVLDDASLDAGRERALLVTRGELRAETGRCAEARTDFSSALSSRHDDLDARALFGRATCAESLGQVTSARKDLEEYLAHFPAGELSGPARRALARLSR